MDRKTVIAVVLAVMVIIASMLVNNAIAAKKKLTLPPEKPATEQQAQQPAAPAGEPAAQPAATGAQEGAKPLSGAQSQAGAPAAGTGVVAAVPAPELTAQSFTLETDVYRVAFSNRGGVVTSIQLKDYKNLDGSRVEMVYSKDTGRYPFSMHFGDADAPAVNDLFYIERSATGNAVSFYRTFTSPSGVPFTLRKTYQFQPRDYLIRLDIELKNSLNESLPLDFGGLAYTLSFGPQIGPPFEKLDRYGEVRQYMYLSEGKPRNVNIPKEGRVTVKGVVSWAAIMGKYFEVIAVPGANSAVTFFNRPLDGLKDRSSVYLSQPVLKSSANTDVFRFYVGPRKREVLARYNEVDKNGFKLADQKFDQSVPSQPLIGWLAAILRVLLDLFYRLIPNYGVAILLLTLVIKLLFWPLTNKSFQSSAKMQALQPKMKELQAKYRQSPQKLNQEMAALYKREGVSPLGGCLPLLLQLPIFFALYNLLSTHFELRGASFIPGWINDLSAPEALVTFAPVNLLVWKVDALRLLPFLMLGTTFLQTKVSQSTTPTDRNMALMTYAMPAMFFFILYNMPSGLVLYWTLQNVLGIVQQLFYNNRNRRKQQEQQGGAEVAVFKKRK